jgi:hypothetical protein
MGILKDALKKAQTESPKDTRVLRKLKDAVRKKQADSPVSQADTGATRVFSP